MAISNEAKIAIVKQNVQQIENTIYDLEIKASVSLRIGDKDTAKSTGDALVKFEKMLAEYNKILSELVPKEDAK